MATLADDERWKPIVEDGTVICENCSQTWSNHSMDGGCPFVDEEASEEARLQGI